MTVFPMCRTCNIFASKMIMWLIENFLLWIFLLKNKKRKNSKKKTFCKRSGEILKLQTKKIKLENVDGD